MSDQLFKLEHVCWVCLLNGKKKTKTKQNHNANASPRAMAIL